MRRVGTAHHLGSKLEKREAPIAIGASLLLDYWWGWAGFVWNF
jgi:hypothetical protein